MPIKKRIDHTERHKYACHKGKAKDRGIEFNLTMKNGGVSGKSQVNGNKEELE